MSKIILRLITETDLHDYQAIKRLKEWRIRNKRAYLGDYKITHQSISKWLKKCVIDNPDRFLFWIMSDGEYIGHIGIKNIKRSSIEIDNLARGIDEYKGAIHIALQKIIEMYPDKYIWLRVLRNNYRAREFYERFGFVCMRSEKEFMIMDKPYWLKDPDGNLYHI